MKTILVLGAAAAVLAACAAQQPRGAAYAGPAGRDAVDVAAAPAGGCFRLREVRNHRIADPRTLYLDVDGREIYRLEMAGSCLSGASPRETLITETPSGSGVVCRPLDLDLKVKIGSGFATPCIVSSLTPLTPAEAAALPKEMRP